MTTYNPLTAAEARQERARRLRYQRPACMSLNWQTIRDDLSTMGDDIYEAAWMDGAYISLMDSFGEDEDSLTEEFRVAFGALSGEITQMWEDMREIEDYQRELIFFESPDPEYDDPPRFFDMFFPAIGLDDMMMGYDIVEHDYFGIDPWSEDAAKKEARQRLKRLTKDQLLDLAGMCMNVARQYLSLRARYDGLNASINILKGRHEELLQVVKGIEELYDEAHRQTEGFQYEYHGREVLKKLDAALSDLPDRFWVE